MSQHLEPQQRSRATDIFFQLIAHCKRSQTNNGRYGRVTLVRLAFENAPSPDRFLCHIYQHVGREESLSQTLLSLEKFQSWKAEQKSELAIRLNTFADYLFDNFFLPRESLRSILFVTSCVNWHQSE